MADFDFEPPSFSLGFDLDLHSEPPPDQLPQPAKQPSTAPIIWTIDEDDDDFESPVGVSDAAHVSGPARPFKRLRRGTTAPKVETDFVARYNVDDEIEDFSSEEDSPTGNPPSRYLCSSSKSSLHANSVLTSESGSKSKVSNRKENSSASASANTGLNGSSFIFPKLTVSPLRRFQLIDSDSDDPSVIEVPSATFSSKPQKLDSNKQTSATFSSKAHISDSSKQQAAFIDLGKKKASACKYQTEDLWKDFCSEKSSHVLTPAFNEMCEEYFTSAKNKSEQEINQDMASLPPANGYFFHKDTRIQNLVRNRLPYFFPLVPEDNDEVKQHYGSGIDYMGQFGNEDNSRQTGPKSSMRNRKKNVKKKSDFENISQDWVNPKSSAGNRKVQEVSKSAGHWYTGEDGRKVYVNKNGQELTGQIAYRHYKKESGKGFKNSKKKTTAKKK